MVCRDTFIGPQILFGQPRLCNFLFTKGARGWGDCYNVTVRAMYLLLQRWGDCYNDLFRQLLLCTSCSQRGGGTVTMIYIDSSGSVPPVHSGGGTVTMLCLDSSGSVPPVHSGGGTVRGVRLPPHWGVLLHQRYYLCQVRVWGAITFYF